MARRKAYQVDLPASLGASMRLNPSSRSRRCCRRAPKEAVMDLMIMGETAHPFSGELNAYQVLSKSYEVNFKALFVQASESEV